jgi:hypothetical protein
MIFGQFLAEVMFSFRIALGGVALWIVLVAAAVLYAREKPV